MQTSTTPTHKELATHFPVDFLPYMMRSLAALVTLCIPAISIAQSETSRPGQENVSTKANDRYASLREAGTRLSERILEDPISRLNYRYGLGLEAALEFAAATNNDSLRRRVLQKAKSLGATSDANISWKQEPFGCLTHAIYRATDDKSWLTGFLNQSVAMKRNIWRDANNVVLHPRGSSRGGGNAMLIDAMQEYSARLSRAAAASKNKTQRDELFTEIAWQWTEYQKQLCDHNTGLWSQGKGWLGDHPDMNSPGAWSRGHGWLLRGLVATLDSLPPSTKVTHQVLSIYQELCASLMPLQQTDGSWHTLLNRMPSESPIDISGTAMISTAFSQGWRRGWLKDNQYFDAASKTFKMMPNYVNKAGQVISVSPGPGPLQSEANYLTESFPIDNDHGVFSVLFAAAEAERLKIHQENRSR